MSGESIEFRGIPALSTPISGEVDAWVKDIIRKGTGFEDPVREMPAEQYARVYRTIKEECKMVLEIPADVIDVCKKVVA